MNRANHALHNFSLYLTVFTGGLVSLALELSAARLLAPVFGTTDLIWSAIIGLILLYLSIGYVLGGRLADQHPEEDLLYTLIAMGGMSIGLIPLVARPVLSKAVQGMQQWNVAWIAGPFIVVLLLFIVPVTLLAFITPFAARLKMTDFAQSGKTMGRIYALSTLGSFIGTLLPNYLLIPWLGTRRTFLLLAILIQLCALFGLWLTHRRRFWTFLISLIALIVLFVLPAPGVKPQAGLLYDEESRYNYIQVLQNEDGSRYLLLNEGQGIHSMWQPFTPGSGDMRLLMRGPWDYYLIAPYFRAANDKPITVDNLLIIGLAAGTSATQFTDVYGAIPIDGVEIDPAIPRVGAEWFGMTQPNLTVHAMDGRTFLQSSSTRYSVIAIDAYRLPYIPWHLTTVEFFRAVREHLQQDGVAAINVGHTPADYRLVNAMATTMHVVFPSVYAIDVPGTLNTIIVASNQPSTPGDFEQNIIHITDPRLRHLASTVPASLRTSDPTAFVFTDDRAPVEFLTNTTALSYILDIPIE